MKFSLNKIAVITGISLITAIAIYQLDDKTQTGKDMITITRCDELKNERSSDLVKIQGRLEQDYFTNKVGRKNYDIAEWYLFLGDGCRIYLKDFDNHIPEFKKTKSQIVILTGMHRYGQIDSDDPNVQSRVGHMLHVKSIQTP